MVGEVPAINQSDILLAPATTPNVSTHKLFIGIGSVAQSWAMPCMIGIGGSYEWPDKRGALEAWAIWAKIGCAF